MFDVDKQLLRELARKCSDSREMVWVFGTSFFLSKGYVVSSVSEIFCVDVCTIYLDFQRCSEKHYRSTQLMYGLSKHKHSAIDFPDLA